MPKVGMEPVRKKQLIEATLDVIAKVGLHGTTISLISKQAGLSSGIISHYFGDKQGLIEATMRYLLDALKIKDAFPCHKERIRFIVTNNFSKVQRADSATNTWLNFWAMSLHSDGLYRLQRVNHKRLESNLAYSFRQLLPKHEARLAASSTAAMIDGYWLRCALCRGESKDFNEACARVLHHVDAILSDVSH